jgi:hypothetical protein
VTAALLPYWALPDLPNDDDPAAWKNYHIEMRRALDRLRRDAKAINQSLNIPAFSAHMNGAGQNFTSSASSAKVLWTHTSLDTHEFFDAANSRFQTQVAGWYHFFAQLEWNSDTGPAGKVRTTQIVKNDAALETPRYASLYLTDDVAVPTVACNSLLYLVSGDFVDVRGYQDSGGDRDILGAPAGTYFHGYKIAD